MVVGPHAHNQRGVKKDWPVVEGLTAETTKQVGDKFLSTKAETSLVPSKDKIGIYKR